MPKITLLEYKPEQKARSQVPVTLEWKNARMVRTHSINAVVHEILNVSKALDVVKVNIIGSPSTGKTTLAKAIAHQCHDLADIPYTVKLFKRDDLLNLELTIAQLQPMNHIMIFDDVSWLSAEASKRQLDRIQKTFTQIRHLPGGQDVKLIIIFNFHYNMAVSKHLRQSDFFFWTSIGSSELDNTQKIVGIKNTQKILEFRSIYQSAITNDFWEFKLGTKGKKFRYEFRKPFGPVLFWNNSSVRHVVFPMREWIEPICAICSIAETTSIKAEMDLTQFNAEMASKFGIGMLKQALRIKLFQMGISTYSRRVKQCMAYLDEYMHQKVFNPEQLANYYGLKDQRTRLDYKLDNDLLDEEPTEPKPTILMLPAPKPSIGEPNEYDSWDYTRLVAELTNMAKQPPESIDVPLYEYLNKMAKEVQGVKAV